MNQEEKIELCKSVMGEVYKDGFNIYRCLNKLKKQIKLRVDFPPDAIIWTCQTYLKDKPKVKEHWPWFIRVFKANSERYFSQLHESEAKSYDKRGGYAQSIKEIMKGVE